MWYPLLNAAQRPVQEFRYDTKYRFITWHTNVWNDNGNFIDVNTYTVTDPRWGQPIEVYSSDGLTTLREYDAFGRLTRNYVPHIAGTPRYSVDMSREWAIDGFYEYTLLLTSDPGGPEAEVYLDILGRPVRTVRESYGHETVSSATGYDARGNRAWETTPHKDTEQFLTIEHTYDAYNRPHEVIPFTGTQQYAYLRTTRPHTAVLGRLPGTPVYRNRRRFPDALPVPGLVLVRLDAQLYFANAVFLRETLLRLIDGATTPVHAVVLDASGIHDVDVSALAALREIHRTLVARGIAFHFAAVTGPVRDVFARSGFQDELGADRFSLTTHDAVRWVLGESLPFDARAIQSDPPPRDRDRRG